jgi:hypothetical protein
MSAGTLKSARLTRFRGLDNPSQDEAQPDKPEFRVKAGLHFLAPIDPAQ